jgi:hypothetical protein
MGATKSWSKCGSEQKHFYPTWESNPSYRLQSVTILTDFAGGGGKTSIYKFRMRNAYKILIRKPEGKRPLGRCRHRWEDIKMDLGEIGWEGVDWMWTSGGGGGGLF